MRPFISSRVVSSPFLEGILSFWVSFLICAYLDKCDGLHFASFVLNRLIHGEEEGPLRRRWWASQTFDLVRSILQSSVTLC